MDDAQGAITAALPAETSPRTDRLELLQQLSAGSVGAVHKAKNPKSNRTLALRQLQVPEWLDDADDLIKKILAEARAASALDHPNIARLITGGYKGFTVFLTSEFVEGTNVKEFIFTRNLGVAEIIALGKQLCLALEFAHQKNVLHYALTPANLKVLPDGTLKILDFGLLRDKHLYSPTPAKRLENEHYLSPEQIKNKPVNQAANLFSVATILYELLTTRNPFAGKHLGEVDRNITEIDPHPASLAHARVSEAISKVLMKGLAKHPMARFQSCAELATALDEALKAVPGKPALSAATPKPATPTSPVKPAPANASTAATPVKVTPAVPTTVRPPASPVRASGNESPQASPAPHHVPPKPSAPVARSQPAPAAAPAKMPAKTITQWKLVGGVVAALFLVSAVAISLNHRSKTPAVPQETSMPAPDPPKPVEQQPVPQPAALAVETSDSTPILDARGAQPRVGRPRTSKGEAVAVPVSAAEGQLAISSDPEGATFSIEGRTTESWKTPQVVGSLAPAVYKVAVSKNGYATENRSVEVVSGNRVSLEVKLTALKGTVNIGGTPLGARIVIDGKETGKFSPAEFTLDPAVHTVSLRREGFFDNAGEVKVVAGQSVSYSPSMTPAGRTDNIKVVGGIKKLFGGGSSTGTARIEIKTEPKGAQISINGAVLPKTTPTEIQVEPGNYDITLQKDGYKPFHKMVTVQANDKVKLEEPLYQ